LSFETWNSVFTNVLGFIPGRQNR